MWKINIKASNLYKRALWKFTFVASLIITQAITFLRAFKAALISEFQL